MKGKREPSMRESERGPVLSHLSGHDPVSIQRRAHLTVEPAYDWWGAR